MGKIIAFADKANLVAKWITYISVTVMTVMVSLQVITRYVFHNSISFSEELARFMFIWSVAIGSSLALRKRSHVKVTLFLDALPKKAGTTLKIISETLALIFFLLLLIFGLVMVFETTGQTSPALGLSMSFVYLAIPLSGFLLLVNSVANISEDMQRLKKQKLEA